MSESIVNAMGMDGAAEAGAEAKEEDAAEERERGERGAEKPADAAAERERVEGGDSAAEERGSGEGAEAAGEGAAEARERAEEAQLRAHFDSLTAQAEELKRMYPGFELGRELENADFFRYTSPAVGMPLKQAYLAVHGEELIGAAMRYAVDRARERTAASVRAGIARPREGGLSGSAGVSVKRDPAAMTAKERADLRARVARGERIVF